MITNIRKGMIEILIFDRGGHNTQATGASSYLDEVTEDRPLVVRVNEYLIKEGNTVVDVSPGPMDKMSDLSYGVSRANAGKADYFFSIHFNSGGGYGCEVIYKNRAGRDYAERICSKLASLGFNNRGAKPDRRGLYEMNNTNMTANIIEVCFVDSQSDAALYRQLGVDKVAKAIAEGIVGHDIEDTTKKGWYQESNIWHYYNENGMVKSGWAKDSHDKWFYLDSNGDMIINGWALYEDKWYYFGGDGEMFTSKWAYWNDDAYYLDKDGIMLTDTITPDGYTVGKDGAWNGKDQIKQGEEV